MVVEDSGAPVGRLHRRRAALATLAVLLAALLAAPGWSASSSEGSVSAASSAPSPLAAAIGAAVITPMVADRSGPTAPVPVAVGVSTGEPRNAGNFPRCQVVGEAFAGLRAGHAHPGRAPPPA